MNCIDCGDKMYSGFCPTCDEEHFIAEQYRELGEPVPESIVDAALEQESRHRDE